MNERIKELYRIASLDDSVDSEETMVEKLTELIIRQVSYDLMDVVAASPKHIEFVAKQYGVLL